MTATDIQERGNVELESLREKISNAIQRGKFTAAEWQAVLAKKSKQAAQKTDEFVHDYTWTSIGLGIGLGFLIGMLAGRTTRVSHELEAEPIRNDADEEPQFGAWDKFQTILPLAVLALRTFQELRGSRNFSHRAGRMS